MEVVGVASSLIAVIEISAKIIKICLKYSLAVKNAKNDIERLQNEVEIFQDVLTRVELLLNGQGGEKLSSSKKLLQILKDSMSQLGELEKKLIPGSGRKIMSRVGVRALKWPLEKKDVEQVINDLEKSKHTINVILQVDMTELVLDIHWETAKIDETRLPTAKGAAFDSYANGSDTWCHEGTRVELIDEILKWAHDPDGKLIFWLKGMAGTGKSTISRTIAQSFAHRGLLGASFFFRKGESDRDHARRFFTTLAAQLVRKMPVLLPSLKSAVDANPDISEKALKEQFDKLILQPLSAAKESFPEVLVIVVDALDECDPQEDISTILRLFSQAKNTISVCLRIFMTSRPNLKIRLSFKKMPEDTYHPKPIINRDISIFLRSRIGKIRDDFNALLPDDSSLDSDWPGEERMQVLINMTIPLFISAATLSRFIGEDYHDPDERLDIILKTQAAGYGEIFDKTYLPILNDILSPDISENDTTTRDFRYIVGSIVIIAEPLSTASLANLLEVPKRAVDLRLSSLHSVLRIPDQKDSPVQLLHLSFRDFLVDPKRSEKSPFCVNESETHVQIAVQCLKLLSRSGSLRQDICNIGSCGMLRADIDDYLIQKALPAVIQYSCRYWVYHLEHGKFRIQDQDEVHLFLQKHFLQWLEALSLIGRISESVAMLMVLQSLISIGKSEQIGKFLYDAKRFVQKNRWIINKVPLQVYSSAIVFAPETSIIKNKFKDNASRWIDRLPITKKYWNSDLEVLEGHIHSVNSVAFSLDGKLLASASSDNTIKLWDPATGTDLQTLKGHSEVVTSVIFSPNNMLASTSYDRTLKLWDLSTGEALQTLECPDNASIICFSPDKKTLALTERLGIIKLWDLDAMKELKPLIGGADQVCALKFSSDGRTLTVISEDLTMISKSLKIEIWDTAAGTTITEFVLQSGWRGSCRVAISPAENLLAFQQSINEILLVDLTLQVARRTLKTNDFLESRHCIVFSENGKLLASSNLKTIFVWDCATGTLLQTLNGHYDHVHTIAFSPKNNILASGSDDKTVKIWDLLVDGSLEEPEPEQSNNTPELAFSPDGEQLLSIHRDRIEFWDVTAEKILKTLISFYVTGVAFSPDHKKLALATLYGGISVWEPRTECLLQTLASQSSLVIFSPNGKTLASAWGESLKLWDIDETANLNQSLTLKYSVHALAFSPDGKLLAVGGSGGTINLRNLITNKVSRIIESSSETIILLHFFPGSELLMSGSIYYTFKIWNLSTQAVVHTFEGTPELFPERNITRDGMTYAFGQELLLQLGFPSPDISLLGAPRPQSIYLKEDWVIKDGRKVLWLPYDFRPLSRSVIDYRGWTVLGNVLAIAPPSMVVAFISFV